MSSSLWFLFIADFFGAALLPEDAALPPVSSAQRTALLAAISEGKKIHYGTGLHSRRTSHFLEATDKPVAGPRARRRASSDACDDSRCNPRARSTRKRSPPQVDHRHPIKATSDTGSVGGFVFGDQDRPSLSLSGSATPRSILQRRLRSRWVNINKVRT